MKTCPRCGFVNNDINAACTNCGTPLPAFNRAMPNQAPVSPKKSNKGVIIGVSVGAAVLLIVAIIVIIVVFSKGGKDDNKSLSGAYTSVVTGVLNGDGSSLNAINGALVKNSGYLKQAYQEASDNAQSEEEDLLYQNLVATSFPADYMHIVCVNDNGKSVPLDEYSKKVTCKENKSKSVSYTSSNNAKLIDVTNNALTDGKKVNEIELVDFDIQNEESEIIGEVVLVVFNYTDDTEEYLGFMFSDELWYEADEDSSEELTEAINSNASTDKREFDRELIGNTFGDVNSIIGTYGECQRELKFENDGTVEYHATGEVEEDELYIDGTYTIDYETAVATFESPDLSIEFKIFIDENSSFLRYTSVSVFSYEEGNTETYEAEGLLYNIKDAENLENANDLICGPIFECKYTAKLHNSPDDTGTMYFDETEGSDTEANGHITSYHYDEEIYCYSLTDNSIYAEGDNLYAVIENYNGKYIAHFFSYNDYNTEIADEELTVQTY